ncbi:Chaperone protein DnaK [bioreactor metagenome]|uniref:Chaperone protein DnaK n=1 Tax=bioreactor metagenome TaxID=1076179 RepID=A0A645DPZ4_9ZZZZ
MHVLQGEREFAKDNKTLGVFHLDGIMPARRGVPQIEVTFDIDANGIVHVSAKDLGTQKEQSISITSSTNMSKDDIEKAVKDAEQFAEEDKKHREEVDMRNGADQMVYQCEKMLSEEGDKFSEDEKKALTEKIDGLKEALKGEDLNLIKSRQDELQAKFYEISERLYKEAAAAAQSAEGDQAQAGPEGGNDNYQEADFTDVE